MLRKVTLWGQPYTLPVDNNTYLVRQVFTRGQCHSFARAMHKLTGWPLVVLGPENRGNARGNGGVRNVGYHVVVQAPNGQFVDIDGAWNGDQWGEVKGFVKESTVKRLGWDRQNVRAAMPFAKAVLDSLPKSVTRARLRRTPKSAA